MKREPTTPFPFRGLAYYVYTLFVLKRSRAEWLLMKSAAG